MATRQSGKKSLISEINITPLTDVFLVLLVIVIIAAPAATSTRQDIKLPEIAKGVGQNSEWPTIEVGADGTMYMDGDSIQESALAERITARITDKKEKAIVIRGDASSRSKAVLSVLRAAQQAGCEQAYIMGVAGEEANALAIPAAPEATPPVANPEKPEAPKTP
ncbi:MAG: biopolymer transporter ExbD [Candidatus Hydrogenedentes bacterium]|nr:biopolymer transporter ExbD [Candidatus Hydrogenedentota bacterium]